MRSDARWRGRLGKTLLSIILALPLGHLVPSRAFAEGQAPGGVVPQRQKRRQHNRPNLDDRVSLFAKSLDLSEAQKSAVKNTLEQRQQQTLRILRDASISGSARTDQLRALQVRTVERIRAILNEEQKKKYDPLATQRIPPTPRPSVEDWLKATTPR
jgi:hypothetical protein